MRTADGNSHSTIVIMRLAFFLISPHVLHYFALFARIFFEWPGGIPPVLLTMANCFINSGNKVHNFKENVISNVHKKCHIPWQKKYELKEKSFIAASAQGFLDCWSYLFELFYHSSAL